MNFQKHIYRYCLGSLFSALLGFAGYWSIRLAWADYLANHSTDMRDLREAIRLAPGCSAYHGRLAQLIDAAGGDGEGELRTAAALKPSDARVLIEIGLRREMRGDLRGAEHLLLRAANASKRFEPRWTLANFYFRRKTEPFWEWARSAFMVSYGDARPLLSLCWAMKPDPDFILRRSIPDRREVLAQYLSFLLHKGRALEAGGTAERLLECGKNVDRSLLLRYVDGIISTSEAVALWNRMGALALVPYAPLDPTQDSVITNPRFLHKPLEGGFDWRTRGLPGVSVNFAPEYCSITLSGKQPESCELLAQYLPVRAGVQYEFAYDFETRGIARNSGVRWIVRDGAGSADMPGETVDLSSDEPATGRLRFSTGRNTTTARIALNYRRPLGMTRIEGSIVLRRVGIRRVS